VRLIAVDFWALSSPERRASLLAVSGRRGNTVMPYFMATPRIDVIRTG
jgi:hypothetical protein